MSGYAVSVRLRGGATRFVPGAGSAFGIADGASPAESVADGPPLDELRAPPRPIGRRLSERLGDLRETWAQTTFYLFDPESWR